MPALLKIKTILVIALLSINTLSLSIFTLSFELNRDYFTEKFCVNKYKPTLDCKGSCHFQKVTKQLKDSESEGQFQAPKIQFEYCISFSEFVSERKLKTQETQHNFCYLNEYSFLDKDDFLIPPQI